MAEKQRDPADDNARDRWQPDENVRGPHPGPNDAEQPVRDKSAQDGEGRDVPPSDRRGRTSPWLGGG